MALAVMMAGAAAAALAQAATPLAVAQAQPPAGPPVTSPLLTQGGAGPARPLGRPAPAAIAAPAPAAAPSTSGVSSYPASFFAAAQPNTAADMIARLPGFTFDDGDTVRGYGGAAGNVLIDGERPASKNDDLDSVLRRIPANQVERIDVIRGGAPGIDMQGKAVMANVIRKKGPGSSLVAALSDQWSMHDGRQVPGLRVEGSHHTADGRSLEGSLLVGGGFDDGSGDGPRVTRDGEGHVISTAQDNTEGEGRNYGLTGAYGQPLWGGKLKLNASANYQKYNFNEGVQDVTSTSLDSYERDRQNQETGELGLNYTKNLSKSLASETVLLQQVGGEDYLALIQTDPAQDGDLQRFREQHFTSESIARETLTWTASRRLTIETGAEGDYNLLHSHTGFTDAGVAQVLPAANVDVDELRGEAFGKATWKATRTLNVELGLRLEASRITSGGDVTLGKTLVYPKPRLLLTWSPTKVDQFRFRLEEEVGQLNFNDFVASSSFSSGQVFAGNPNLEPQQALVVEGAWERHFLKDGDAVLTLRHSQLTDVEDRAPVFSPSGVFDTPANIGDGFKDEAILTVSLPLVRFGIPGGLLKTDTTWRRSEVTDPTTHQTRPISGLRPFEGDVAFTQDLPRWKLTWGGSVNLGWTQRYFYFNQVETDRLTPLGDLFVEVKPAKGWSVRAELEDLGITFDRKLALYDNVRMPGPPDTLQDRDLAFGPTAYFRVRRTW
ncbi:MAG: TonB-dependent receptor plug domain-containing protein [Caulobacteraceae bacterium]|nr:TonB-dependent receptor plug domain-containing protein [Caulobacter sp.]